MLQNFVISGVKFLTVIYRKRGPRFRHSINCDFKERKGERGNVECTEGLEKICLRQGGVGVKDMDKRREGKEINKSGRIEGRDR